jgi:hypothetical protein
VFGRHKFSVGKNFEVENFQLLTMTFSENFLSVEIFPEWKCAFSVYSSEVDRLCCLVTLTGTHQYVTYFIIYRLGNGTNKKLATDLLVSVRRTQVNGRIAIIILGQDICCIVKQEHLEENKNHKNI